MNPIRIMSYRAQHVFEGAVYIVIAKLVREADVFVTLQPGFWRMAIAIGTACAMGYGLIVAVTREAEAIEELVIRIVAAAFFSMLLYSSALSFG